MIWGRLYSVGIGYSVKTPEVVTLATLFTFCTVNQRFPSGPDTISTGMPSAVGTRYSVKAPDVVTLATLLVLSSVNQTFPSGPAVMPPGVLPALGVVYLVNVPGSGRGLIRKSCAIQPCL